MYDIQIHALGLHAAVNGVALSLHAAKCEELRRAIQAQKLKRKAERQQRRTLRRDRQAYTTAV